MVSMSDRPKGKDGKLLMSDGEFGFICDILERTWHHWPLDHDDENPDNHTSDGARDGAMRIVRELDMTTVPANTIPYPAGLPADMRDLWDMRTYYHNGDEAKFKELARGLIEHSRGAE